MQSLTHFLLSALMHTVNPVKSQVALMSECSFLGFTLVVKKIRWTEKSLANFKHRVRQLTGRSWGLAWTTG